ncbi:MAG: DEAD/DEAH box helicase, partial [Planctomycetaceae bacterium]
MTCTWRTLGWKLGFRSVAVPHCELQRRGTVTGENHPVAALKSKSTIGSLRELVPLMHQTSGFADVIAAMQSGESGAIDGAWGSACALVNSALAAVCPETLLIVLPRPSDVDLFAADLLTFHGEPATVFPAWESLPDEHEISDTVFGSRLRVLSALRQTSPVKLILTTFSALLQPVPARTQIQESTRPLAVGDEVDIETLIEWLVERGCRQVPVIELPGEVSHHGGILDIFSPDALHPVRIEFFGDEIESMRWFDTETQQQIRQTDAVELAFVAPVTHHKSGERSSKESGAEHRDSGWRGESLLDSLSSQTWVALVSLSEMLDEGQQYLSRLSETGELFTVEESIARLTDFPSVTVDAIGADSTEVSCLLRIESVERFATADVMSELETLIGSRESVVIACHNEGERSRLSELLESTSIADRVDLCLGEVSRGFRLVDERILVLSDHELFGRREILRRERPSQAKSRAIDSFIDLNPGDLVVHVAKGIARYRGMQLLDKGDQVEEHLVLEFRDGVRVYVPVPLIQLVQKYVGAARGSVDLSKLGTTAWSRKKQRVADAVDDMASEMIRFQAEREAKPGIEFPPDTNWQTEFEAAFPYHETRDQAEAILDSKQDMQRSRPMDRLICGDVGYGKTEVAMRAAFKAICTGYQVAVLVPTTILAEQHLRTFNERMAQFPVTIAGLSRFKTKAQQRQTVDGLATGAVDIVIGTHRLIQKDIRFKNLGLLIIDEEHRFGVKHKEQMARLRATVDCIVLSATPSGRTAKPRKPPPASRTLHSCPSEPACVLAHARLRALTHLHNPPLDPPSAIA